MRINKKVWIMLCLLLFSNVALARCLSINDSSHSCRYQAGDAWCSQHQQPPYAYLKKCNVPYPVLLNKIRVGRENEHNEDNVVFSVVNVSSDDVLNIRESASARSKKVGYIPYNASCVSFFGDTYYSGKRKWIKVRYKNIQGWVNSRYLRSYNSSHTCSNVVFSVVNVSSDDVLNIRESASARSKKVGYIPYNASCVSFFGDTYYSGKRKWIKIRYKNIQGWVNSRYLRPYNSLYTCSDDYKIKSNEHNEVENNLISSTEVLSPQSSVENVDNENSYTSSTHSGNSLGTELKVLGIGAAVMGGAYLLGKMFDSSSSTPSNSSSNSNSSNSSSNSSCEELVYFTFDGPGPESDVRLSITGPAGAKLKSISGNKANFEATFDYDEKTYNCLDGTYNFSYTNFNSKFFLRDMGKPERHHWEGDFYIDGTAPSCDVKISEGFGTSIQVFCM